MLVACQLYVSCLLEKIKDGTCYAAAAATRPRRRKQSTGLFPSANCVCSLLFKSRPDYTAKQKEPLLRLFLFWCERRDLNPYGITTRPSNVRVCRFRHSRIQLLFPCGTFNIISDKIVFVNCFFNYFTIALSSLFRPACPLSALATFRQFCEYPIKIIAFINCL